MCQIHFIRFSLTIRRSFLGEFCLCFNVLGISIEFVPKQSSNDRIDSIDGLEIGGKVEYTRNALLHILIHILEIFSLYLYTYEEHVNIDAFLCCCAAMKSHIWINMCEYKHTTSYVQTTFTRAHIRIFNFHRVLSTSYYWKPLTHLRRNRRKETLFTPKRSSWINFNIHFIFQNEHTLTLQITNKQIYEYAY